MNFTYSWASIKSFLRQAASIAGLFVTIANTDHLPTSVRSVIAAVSGILLTVDHYVEKTATTTAPTTTTVVNTVNPTSTGASS
jgi:hypothetical protein